MFSPRASGTILYAIMLALIACGIARAQPVVVQPRVDVVARSLAVVPVRNDRNQTGLIAVGFGTGHEAVGELVRVDRETLRACDRNPWLPEIATLRESGVSSDDPSGPTNTSDSQDGDTMWVVRFRVPRQGIGTRIRIGGRDTPAAAWTEPERSTTLPRVVGTAALGSSWVRDAVDALSRDPRLAWRADLITGGLFDPARAIDLGPNQEMGQGTDDDAGLAPGSLIERWAQQERTLWRAAFARLVALDRPLAERVASRLGGIVQVGNEWVPVWADATAPPSELRDLLLDPALSDELRLASVRSWLARAPDAVAWVIDDAVARQTGNQTGNQTGAQPGRQTGGPVQARVGVVNLTTSARPAWTDPLQGGVSPQLTPAPAGRTTELTATVSAGDAPRPVATSGVHLGDWTIPVAYTARVVGLTPPGLIVGPLRPHTDMASFVSGRSTPGVVPISGVLSRGPRPGASANAPEGPAPGREHGWIVELDIPMGTANAPKATELTVWFGRRGRSTGRVRLAPGAAIDAVLPGSPRVNAEQTLAGDRWRVRVEVPEGALDRDGLLRLALELTDDCGGRASWPRPMLPWQDEPARIAIDLDAWFGFR